MSKLIDAEQIIERLEEYARSKICDSHRGCPYREDDDISCENCGAIGALEIVKEGVSA